MVSYELVQLDCYLLVLNAGQFSESLDTIVCIPLKKSTEMLIDEKIVCKYDPVFIVSCGNYAVAVRTGFANESSL